MPDPHADLQRAGRGPETWFATYATKEEERSCAHSGLERHRELPLGPRGCPLRFTPREGFGSGHGIPAGDRLPDAFCHAGNPRITAPSRPVHRFRSRAADSLVAVVEHWLAHLNSAALRRAASADMTCAMRRWLTSSGVGLPKMPDEFLVTCPFCGEDLEIYIEPDVNGSFVQDCEVCCNPWRVHVSGRDDDRVARVTRADGSE